MVVDPSTALWRLPIGANVVAGGTRFRIWAADAHQVEVVLYDPARPTTIQMLVAEGDGYFAADVPGVGPGAWYMYRVDGGEPRPDPAARSQPESVHGPSCVVDPAAFVWTDTGWYGLPREDLVIYELHVGTATPEGTFDALIGRLDDLRALGVTAIELMPVADFPGERSWGYDGVCLFAPARTYGGPEGLRRLVDAAHARGLAVLLDMVYNHLGPDGNYLRQFSRAYFTDRHVTPWGEALNFDGPDSQPVRAFFIANACYWAHEYHIDGLRLDATHAILDESPTHILAELAASVRATLPPDRHFQLIAENERNDPTLARPPAAGGYGLDGIWADDFHHQMRVALAGDRDGYYADYRGTASDLAATLRQGWFYTGQDSPYLGQPRGAPADDLPFPAFIHCIQNHDQIGNRALGDRLHHQIGLDAYRAATALLLLSPATPLLFMGQEWAASSPFQFFTDHHEELGRLVTEGRRAEFATFAAFAGAAVPDPQALETFVRSKLRWTERAEPPHAGVLRLYRDLLDLRRQHPALRERSRDSVAVVALGERTLALRQSTAVAPGAALLALVHLGGALAHVDLGAQVETAAPGGYHWAPMLDSEAPLYGGSGEALAAVAGPLLLERPRAIVWQAVPVHGPET
jgi:maltooligosyltrehalose trehalohydrolase